MSPIHPRLEIVQGDLSAYAQGNIGVDYVHRFESGKPGPHVLINALTHGNEICGMVAATQTEFIVMSPDVLAEVQESAGSLDPADGNESDPLQQFRAVKSITDGTP